MAENNKVNSVSFFNSRLTSIISIALVLFLLGLILLMGLLGNQLSVYVNFLFDMLQAVRVCIFGMQLHFDRCLQRIKAEESFRILTQFFFQFLRCLFFRYIFGRFDKRKRVQALLHPLDISFFLIVFQYNRK